MRVLVLGVTGMLGAIAFQVLDEEPGLTVFGSVRGPKAPGFLGREAETRILTGIDAQNLDSIVNALGTARPDVVLNCIGVIKQLASAKDPLVALPLNSLFPHQLAHLCRLAGARLIHISTDCVFSGRRGNYHETDLTDAEDLYGRSKALGEVEYPHAITLRTSIIGRENGPRNGLVEWFLHERGTVPGFTNVLYSGLTTIELTRVIRRYILPNPELSGLYQISSDAISKHDLLELIKSVYGLDTVIVPDGSVKIDRTLNSSRFREETGYVPPNWPEMIHDMYVLDTERKGES